MSATVWNDAQILAQLNTGQSWAGSSITFSFPLISSDIYGSGEEAPGFLALNPMQAHSANLAIQTWGDLIGPDFVALPPGVADITFGLTDTGIEFAHAYYPPDGGVWFNRNEVDLVEPLVGGYGFGTYIHEIGHAIGLDHMGVYNGTDVDLPSCWQDSSVYSIMSYFGPSNSSGGEGLVAWADWVGGDGVRYSAQTPMINDVMAIQSIYGYKATRSEDTTYGFGSTIQGDLSEIYDFSLNQNPILCIYDSDGVDTLDLSGFLSASVVDLVGGVDHFSSCNGMTSNIQIVRGVVIENAVTGNGDDLLIGNHAANLMSGGDGYDTLRGSLGNDELLGGKNGDRLFGGQGNDLLRGGSGLDKIEGGVGDDTLLGALGKDVLTGGEGDDAFRFSTALDEASNVDWITDFNAAYDVIELSASIFSAFSGQIGQRLGLGQHLKYDQGSKVLSYDADPTDAVSGVPFVVVELAGQSVSFGFDFLIV